MGNSAGTRKITIVNDEEGGVIKISDSVVRRLKGEHQEEPQAKQAPNEPRKPIELPQGNLPPSRHSAFIPYEELHTQIRHIRQQKDEEIEELEHYWKEKLEKAENHANELQTRTTEEYNVIMKRIDAMFPKEVCGPTCLDKEDQVLKCYQQNADRSLNCSQEVREFAKCVHRSQLVRTGSGSCILH